jgi:hypothetical protein
LYSLHKISVSVLFILLFSPAAGSDPFILTAGGAEAGMNYSCVMKSGFWSSFHNQALLPQNKYVSFGLSYLNRFNISELGTRSAGLVIPSGKACFGAHYSHFGYKDFFRHSAGLACGIKLSEKISAGVQTDFFSEKTSGEYNERLALSFEAGLLITPSEKVRIGLHLFNPVPGSLRRNYLPSALRAGIGIQFNKSLFAGAEVEMTTGNIPEIKTGFEYEPVRNFRLRGGFSSENTSFSFGVGYLLNSVQIDLGFLTHESLGITSCVSVIFQIKQESKVKLIKKMP